MKLSRHLREHSHNAEVNQKGGNSTGQDKTQMEAEEERAREQKEMLVFKRNPYRCRIVHQKSIPTLCRRQVVLERPNSRRLQTSHDMLTINALEEPWFSEMKAINESSTGK